jgi:endonuclease YncB( thermonuclease family)
VLSNHQPLTVNTMNKLPRFTAVAALLCAAIEQPLNAALFPAEYEATLIRVIDGDTIKLQLEIYPKLYKEVNLRVAGIDTPEVRRGKKNGKAIPACEVIFGKATRQYVRQLLKKSKRLQVKNVDLSKTKYANRINGELFFDGQSYAQHMLDRGWAVTYNGGPRTLWPCSRH